MKYLNSNNTIEAWFWLQGRLDGLHAHFTRRWPIYVMAMVAVWVFTLKYELNINVSNSLGGTLYIVEKNALPQRGEYVAFLYQSDFIYPKNARFLKRVVGIAGDTVECKDHQFFVNKKPVGKALPVTTFGFPIEESGFRGVIPRGYYYVMGDHPKSLDSRYKAVGLVSDKIVFGRGFRLF